MTGKRRAMRIGLYHGPLYRGAAAYESYGPYVRYVHEFARHFDQVVVFAPVTTGVTDYRGCRIEPANVRVVELPDFSTHVQASRHLPTIYRTFRREIGALDVINCRNTAPFGYLLYVLGRPRGVGFFYHFVSDPLEILRTGPRYRGLYGVFARSAYQVDYAVQRHVMRRTFSFVISRRLYERLRPVTDRLELVVSSTLSESDLYQRAGDSLHQPVRLLYVGYLKHMKGLEYLLEALRIVRQEGIEAELHLVGSGPEEAKLRARADRLSLSDHARFHGYVPMGPELNRHFKKADIFVFPSLSEGGPRVVLEALAHSLPVVSTDVGIVPDLIADGESGLIVPIRDAGALARAVIRYVRDDVLRQRCQANGFLVAKKHTVEQYIAPIVQKAKELARKGTPKR